MLLCTSVWRPGLDTPGASVNIGKRNSEPPIELILCAFLPSLHQEASVPEVTYRVTVVTNLPVKLAVS